MPLERDVVIDRPSETLLSVLVEQGARLKLPPLPIGALVGRALSDRYFLACTAVIGIWLMAWLASFGNIYGWLTDDIAQFRNVQQYERGGQNLVDIAWFHAFDWFIVALPWYFHWSVPSHIIPQAWDRTGEFRALILYVIVLHAVLLAMVAYFTHQLCGSKLVCFGAFLLFATSPTFMLYADLIDSRYLGLLAGLPALTILIRQRTNVGSPLPWQKVIGGFFLPGFLIGLGQSIHYTLLYFAIPFATIYWMGVIIKYRSRIVILRSLAFILGLVAWFGPVELLSLAFHPFDQSMLGIMIGQVHALGSHYNKVADIASWFHFFYEQMGAPMMIAVAIGIIIVSRASTRPAYLSGLQAQLMLGATAIATVYLLFTSSVPFYRQVSAYQIFYMLFAMIAIDVTTRHLNQNRSLRLGAQLLAFICVAFVPSVVRMPEVFTAAQGLGRAVNLAHKMTGEHKVYFIEFYDTDVHPQSIISRSDFNHLQPGDYIVTDFPTFYFVKYADIFALMHEAKPVASFPTEWCTNENWVEERTYWEFRRYQEEPESCNAQVFSVDAIREAEQAKPLEVASVRTDSSLPGDGPAELFEVRNPRVPIDFSMACCNRGPVFERLWSSKPTAGPHWVDIKLARPALLSSMTIVPANYLAPPLFTQVARPASLQLFGVPANAGRSQLLWSSAPNVRDAAIVSATFTPIMLRELELRVTQPNPITINRSIALEQRLVPSEASAIEYIHFPGYSVKLDSSVAMSSQGFRNLSGRAEAARADQY